MLQRRPLGQSGMQVTPVGLGCWPISGMTSIDVNPRDSADTIRAAMDCGVNFLDTAFCYGANGESERLIADAIVGRRDDLVLATKCGIHWNSQLQRVVDGRPATLQKELEESLRRLKTDRVDLLYLHAPDPQVPLEASAQALLRIVQRGQARSIGVSNFDLPQLQRFHSVCRLTAVQPPYNMLQRQIEKDLLPWCIAQGVALVVYWPLMKGLLAGRLRRGHCFDPRDGRAKYPMYQGTEWEKNQVLLDQLQVIADSIGKTVSQLVINWTIHQPGITCALCGAKREWQIRETAAAMQWTMDGQVAQRIAEALRQRGDAATRSAI